MKCTVVTLNKTAEGFLREPILGFLILLAGWSAAVAQDTAQPANSSASVRVTHLMGFEGASHNANGTLSIQGDALQFQKSGKPAVEVKIASVQDVFLGDQSKQLGGLPMTLGKAAVPFGGGRAISLFAHKNYDTLTVEYVDTDGGAHGAIFQMNKGQAAALRNELIARGLHISGSEDAPKQSAAEVPSESK